MFNGYTVKHSVDVIDEICNDPGRYKNEIQGAINDIKIHYKYGVVTKQHMEYVVMTLEKYKRDYM